MGGAGLQACIYRKKGVRLQPLKCLTVAVARRTSRAEARTRLKPYCRAEALLHPNPEFFSSLSGPNLI
jgi:hypothetical protein